MECVLFMFFKNDIIHQESISFRAKKEQSIAKSDCSEDDSFQLYQVADLLPNNYGICIFLHPLKMAVFHRKTNKSDVFPTVRLFSGHASQAFQREALKNRYEKNADLWKRSIAPPKLLHGSTSAFRTDG